MYEKWSKMLLPVWLYNKQNNTWLRVDMDYLFLCSTLYLTCSLHLLTSTMHAYISVLSSTYLLHHPASQSFLAVRVSVIYLPDVCLESASPESLAFNLDLRVLVWFQNFSCQFNPWKFLRSQWIFQIWAFSDWLIIQPILSCPVYPIQTISYWCVINFVFFTAHSNRSLTKSNVCKILWSSNKSGFWRSWQNTKNLGS